MTMPANDFLQPGSTTTLTLLYDRPRQGATRYGPYQLRLGRGSHLTVRTSQRMSSISWVAIW